MQHAGSAGAADKSIGPSARKERGPQDDNAVFRALAKAGQRLAEIHVHYEQQPEYKLMKVLRLIGQVLTVSLETVKIVRELPPLHLPKTPDK